MKKRLPGVFPGKVKRNTGNNKQVFYSSKDSEISKTEEPQKPNIKIEKNINQKINEIFNSSNYIYKADVEIILKDKTITKRIVGRNRTNLITMENELIPITDVIDIKRKQD